MSDESFQKNASEAGERFFRLYHSHCTSPNTDTLFSLLGSIHSLNDRLKISHDLDFFDSEEFIALKCLRNFFHHHDELKYVVRFVPLHNYSITTDLLTMCLVSDKIIQNAIDSTLLRHKEQTRSACQAVFHWYGLAVNINPALFNFGVSVYERMSIAEIPLSGDAFEEFEASYKFEEENGHSHRIDGRIFTHAGSLEQIISEIMNTKGL